MQHVSGCNYGNENAICLQILKCEPINIYVLYNCRLEKVLINETCCLAVVPTYLSSRIHIRKQGYTCQEDKISEHTGWSKFDDEK